MNPDDEKNSNRPLSPICRRSFLIKSATTTLFMAGFIGVTTIFEGCYPIYCGYCNGSGRSYSHCDGEYCNYANYSDGTTDCGYCNGSGENYSHCDGSYCNYANYTDGSTYCGYCNGSEQNYNHCDGSYCNYANYSDN